MADAVAATIAAGDRGVPGRAYNIGGGSRVSVNQVLEIIGRIAGRPLDVRREPAQKGDMRDTYADTALARADLGFAPTVSLEEGIEAEYRWLSTTPALRMRRRALTRLPGGVRCAQCGIRCLVAGVAAALRVAGRSGRPSARSSPTSSCASAAPRS